MVFLTTDVWYKIVPRGKNPDASYLVVWESSIQNLNSFPIAKNVKFLKFFNIATLECKGESSVRHNTANDN